MINKLDPLVECQEEFPFTTTRVLTHNWLVCSGASGSLNSDTLSMWFG